MSTVTDNAIALKENFVLLGHEMSMLLIAGSDAWVQTCRDVQSDEPLLLTKPIREITTRLSAMKLVSSDLVALLNDALLRLARIVAKVACLSDTANPAEIDKSMAQTFFSLSWFALQCGHAQTKRVWTRHLDFIDIYIRVLIDERLSQSGNNNNNKARTALSPSDDPTIVLTRMRLINAFEELGKAFTCKKEEK